MLGIFLIVAVLGAVNQIVGALKADSLPRSSAWRDDDTLPIQLDLASNVELSGFLTVAYYDSRQMLQPNLRLVLAVDDGRILPVRLFQSGFNAASEITKKVRNQLERPKYVFGRWQLLDGIVYADYLHLGFVPERKWAQALDKSNFEVHLQPLEFLNVKGTLPIGEIASRWVGKEADLPRGEFVLTDILKQLKVPFDQIDLKVSQPKLTKWDRFSCLDLGWWNEWIESRPQLQSTEFLIHPAVASCDYSSISLMGVGRVLLNGIFGHSSRQMLHAFLHTRGLRHLGAHQNESGDETCLMGRWWQPGVLSRWAVDWLPEADFRDLNKGVKGGMPAQASLSISIPESATGQLKLVRFGEFYISADSGALRGPPGFPLLVHRKPHFAGNDQVHSSFQREAVLYHGQRFSFENLEIEAGDSHAEGRVDVTLRRRLFTEPVRVLKKTLVKNEFCISLNGNEAGQLIVRTLTSTQEISFRKFPWNHSFCETTKGLSDSFSLSWKGSENRSYRVPFEL
ncbi:MAG: hypothetical protein K2X47_20035 [Bdellovibrionales bacterium]|nr:hypothetical protein [Bdellovibrionales bacterium]